MTWHLRVAKRAQKELNDIRGNDRDRPASHFSAPSASLR
jgi:hypothetical protein